MLFFIIVPLIAIGVAATRSNFTRGEKVGIAILAIGVGLTTSLGAQFAYGLMLGLFIGLAGSEKAIAALTYSEPWWLTLPAIGIGLAAGGLSAYGVGRFCGWMRSRRPEHPAQLQARAQWANTSPDGIEQVHGLSATARLMRRALPNNMQ